MNRDARHGQSSRRGFLRTLLGAEDPAEVERQQAHERRASLLAFKYAKDEANLLKLGVQAPVHIAEARYSVKISGQNESGEAFALELEVDAESETVVRLEPGGPPK